MDGLDERNGNVCIGLDVAVARRGVGLGRRCYGLLLRYCFEELRMHMVWLWTADFNSPAIHLYESLGFERAGRLRHALYRKARYWDVLLMQLTRETWERAVAKQPVAVN
jgi:RimJ/RimL family protein N-acetyltransferase